MKKSIVPMMVLLLPVILLSSVFDTHHNNGFDVSMAFGRAYRMLEQVTSAKESDQWLPVTRVTPFYRNNESAVVDSFYLDMYDIDSEEWMIGAMKSYFVYNAAGRIVSNTIYMNMMNMLIPMAKVESFYDNQNRIIKNYVYGGDLMNLGSWVIQNRMHIIHGNGTAFEVYSWEELEDDVRSSMYYHSTFQFDAQGRIIEELSYESPDSTSWVQDSKGTFVYHPQDTSTGESFIEYASAGLPMMLANDGFDFPGLITLNENFEWDGSAWVPDYRTTGEYNDQLKLSSRHGQYYESGTWMEDFLSTYFYDANGNSDYTIGQYYNGSSWQDEERIDYTWENYSAANHDGVAPALNLQVNAYPSPFNACVTIALRSESKAPVKVSIHNLRGQNIRSFVTDGSSNVTWDGKYSDGSSAPAGIYFIRAQQDGNNAVRKVMRVK